MIGQRSRLPLTALGAAFGALALAVAVLARPESLIGAAFEGALASAKPASTIAETSARPQSPAFDPRHIRPSSLPAGPSLAGLGPLRVGEHVRIATIAGEQVLEVVEMHPLVRSALPGQDYGSAAELLLVTLRADDDNGTTMRLIVERAVEPVVPGAASALRQAL